MISYPLTLKQIEFSDKATQFQNLPNKRLILKKCSMKELLSFVFHTHGDFTLNFEFSEFCFKEIHFVTTDLFLINF